MDAIADSRLVGVRLICRMAHLLINSLANPADAA
jgi:hypothetical protein